MENKLDILVANSLTPYIVVEIVLNHNKKEIEDLENKAENIISDEYRKLMNEEFIIVDINTTNKFIFLKKKHLSTFIENLKLVGYNFEIYNALHRIWNMKNLSLFTDFDPIPELTEEAFNDFNPMDILKVMVENKYSLDDVLSKINDFGVNSLNELNKFVLDKESH